MSWVKAKKWSDLMGAKRARVPWPKVADSRIPVPWKEVDVVGMKLKYLGADVTPGSLGKVEIWKE